MTDAHDSVIPEEHEAAALERLEALFREVGGLQARFETIEVHPNSSLAIERRLVPRQPLEYRARNYIGAATDNLQTLHTVLETGLPLVGSYALIRAAIEACALGIWAVDPGTRDARIFRAVHMGWHEHLKVADVARKLGRPPVNLERIRRRHDQIKDSRPGLRQKSLDRDEPNMTDVLLHVERRLGSFVGYGPLVAWSICSSMAHGNQVMQHTILERRYLGEDDGVGAMWHTTSSFAMNAMLMEPVVTLLAYLVDNFELQSTPEVRGRRAQPQP